MILLLTIYFIVFSQVVIPCLLKGLLSFFMGSINTHGTLFRLWSSLLTAVLGYFLIKGATLLFVFFLLAGLLNDLFFDFMGWTKLAKNDKGTI